MEKCIERLECNGCGKSTYLYDACRRCSEAVCFKCWEIGHCQCGSIPSIGDVPMDEVSRARRWLVAMLNQPRYVSYLKETAKEYGIKWMSARRAKDGLKIKVLKVKSQWTWTLEKKSMYEIFNDEHLDYRIPVEGDHGQF